MASAAFNLFIYFFREFDEGPYFDEFRARFPYSYAHTDVHPSLENAKLAVGFDSISITPCPINAELLETFYGYGVRNIVTRSIGYEHIDLEAAKQLKMQIAHVSYPPDAVADYTIMLMMMCLRKMPYILSQAAVQNYTLNRKMGRSLMTSTIGVIGCGAIGQTVIHHLASFGCRILAYDPYIQPASVAGIEWVSFDDILSESDVITLHVPASASNYHLLDTGAFAKMKPGCVVINTSRGTLIDTDALIDALEAGKVSSAGLDVLEDETNLYYRDRGGECINNRQLAILRSFPNVILTPHMAFYTEESIRGMVQQTVQCTSDMVNHIGNPLIIV